MPTPNPDNESRSEWMERCIPVLIDEGKDDDQAVAICSSMWEQAVDNDSLELDDDLIDEITNAEVEDHTDQIIEFDPDLFTGKESK